MYEALHRVFVLQWELKLEKSMKTKKNPLGD